MREGESVGERLIRRRTIEIPSSARFGFLALPRSPSPYPTASSTQERTRMRTRRGRSFVTMRVAQFPSSNASRRRFAIGTGRSGALAPRTIRRDLLPPRETIESGVQSATNRRSNSREVIGGSSRLRSSLDVFFRDDESIGVCWIGIGKPRLGGFEISQNPRMLLRTSCQRRSSQWRGTQD